LTATMSISRSEATELIETAVDFAEETEYALSIAVVDGAGFLVSFQRQDEGRVPNAELAIKKARTSARWKRPTAKLSDVVQPGKQGYGIQHSDSEVNIVKGGLPILDESGDVIGAISADGAPTDVDQKVCENALAEHGYPTEF